MRIVHWKLTGKISLACGAMILAITPSLASAEFASIAFGSKPTGAWTVRATQAEANADALSLCNVDNARKDCSLAVDKAIARAENGAGQAFYRRDDSVAGARAGALKSCGDPGCTVKVFTTPGFYTLAKPTGEEDGSYFLSYGGDDSNSTKRNAIAKCEERNAKPCEALWSKAIGGKLQASASSAPPAYKITPASTNSCRPNTPTIRCSSQCTNGSCTVTYDNGCRTHVNVSPKFDPFNNQWTYPSPSC